MTTNVEIPIKDINPLEHITSDVAISQYNYESILNGLRNWDQSKMDTITIRLATTTEPYFVDYTLPTKWSYDTVAGLSIAASNLQGGNFSYNERYDLSASYDPDSTKCDSVTVRFSVQQLGNTMWRLYQMNTLYDEISAMVEDDGTLVLQEDNVFSRQYVKNLLFRRSVKKLDGKYTVSLYKTLLNVEENDIIDVGINCIEYVRTSADGSIANLQNHIQMYDGLVLYDNAVYGLDHTATFNPTKLCTDASSGMRKVADVYDETVAYAYGSYVYYGGEFFVALKNNPEGIAPYIDEFTDMTNRLYNPEYWESVVFSDTYENITTSMTYRSSMETDISGYVLQNMSTVQSTDTSIHAIGNVHVNVGESKPHYGLEVFDTCNYARWPSKEPKWSQEGVKYETNMHRDAYSLQEYTATMVFNHADPQVKYKNIINYDGPDLDQGLCIFLPVKSYVEGEGDVTPPDGTMFEFLFRIWPRPELNGNIANDLTINKAQIYVYSIDDYTQDFSWSTSINVGNVTPIAKFSMARMTNFYVFAENIAVPDRPVMYKARFIYSKNDQCWKTYDYYQMPDHIFLSPLGFVDPSTNGAYGVQTAGFPTYQDPFCDYDLNPIYANSDYINRIYEFSEADEAPIAADHSQKNMQTPELDDVLTPTNANVTVNIGE